MPEQENKGQINNLMIAVVGHGKIPIQTFKDVKGFYLAVENADGEITVIGKVNNPFMNHVAIDTATRAQERHWQSIK